jgi:hypothetical protein
MRLTIKIDQTLPEFISMSNQKSINRRIVTSSMVQLLVIGIFAIVINWQNINFITWFNRLIQTEVTVNEQIL